MSSVTFDEDEFLLCPSSTRTDATSETTSSSSHGYYRPSTTYSTIRSTSSSATSSLHDLDCKNLICGNC